MFVRIFSVLIICLGMLGFWGKTVSTIPQPPIIPPYLLADSPWADSLIQTLTLDEKIGQLFMVAANGRNTDEIYYKSIDSLIENYGLGGLIYFQSNPTDHTLLVNRFQSKSNIPLMNGIDPGFAWHGAKIAECGALCSSNPTSGVVIVEFDKTGFNVEAMSDSAICTPESVSAHMLYENADPYILYEPGGYMDVTNACYQSINSRKVRVQGGLWVSSKKYTVKLEGARVSGYQTSLLVLLRDNNYVKNAIKWTEKLSIFLSKEIKQRMNLDAHEYSLNFRHIGLNAVLGDLEKNIGNPSEVGVLCIITSKTPNVCTEIAKLINPFLLHFPLTVDEELPTFAFPYSPVHSDRGCVYEFALHHVLELNDPMDAFQIKTLEI